MQITRMNRMLKYLQDLEYRFLKLQLWYLSSLRSSIIIFVGHYEEQQLPEEEISEDGEDLLSSREIAQGLTLEYQATTEDGVKLYAVVNTNTQKIKQYYLGDNHRQYHMMQIDLETKH